MKGYGYHIPITDEVRQRARDLYPIDRPESGADLGIEARIVGAFGEAVFETAMLEVGIPTRYVGRSSITHDFETPLGRFEVKTKASQYAPRETWFAGFSEEGLGFQDADVFVFVALYPRANAEDGWSYQDGYVVGYRSREEFLELSTHEPVGTIMGGGRPSTRAMRTLRFEKLLPFSSLAARGLTME